MKWTFSVCVLLLALTGCNAAKQVSQQSQYVPVPAVTGQWTIAATVGGSTSTIQANLVSVPCTSIDSLTYTPISGPSTVSSWALSCSLADNLTGSGSMTGTEGNFYDPPQVLVVATGTSGSSTNPTTTMNYFLLECSGTSTECYTDEPEVIFVGQNTLSTPSSDLSGTWECQGGASSPCGGQTGTFAATKQ
jgi:hypothetical protein